MQPYYVGCVHAQNLYKMVNSMFLIWTSSSPSKTIYIKTDFFLHSIRNVIQFKGGLTSKTTPLHKYRKIPKDLKRDGMHVSSCVSSCVQVQNVSLGEKCVFCVGVERRYIGLRNRAEMAVK